MFTNGSGMFNGCTRLEGGVDDTVPKSTIGASACVIGPGGVLTYPGTDVRTRFYAHFYAHDGACAIRDDMEQIYALFDEVDQQEKVSESPLT